MKTIRTFATGALLVVSFAAFAAAQQPAQTPARKPAVKQEAGAKAAVTKPAAKVQLPTAIADAFKKTYPDAVIKNVAKEVENGKTVYEVESTDKGMGRDLIYNPDGTVSEIEEEIKPADLPAPVSAALHELHPKATIAKAEKLTRGTVVEYEFALKGDAKKSVSFTPDGKPVAAAPEKK
ncbi:MAG TPA: PepSY-like domain-containing protein [Vicinamibacterales bacterium]|jgi:hypothetical protein